MPEYYRRGKFDPVGGSPEQDPVFTPSDQYSSIDDEIAALENELAQMQQMVSDAAGYVAPQAPGLPGAEMLQNPLLMAIQDDVTRRVFANQAAGGRLGGTETAAALQNALAPTALNLGLTLQGREQAQQQQNISNLMNLFGMGANVAAGQGNAGITSASGIGSSLQSGGLAQGQGALGQAAAITGGLTSIFGPGGFAQQYIPSSPVQSFTGELGGFGGFRPTIQGSEAAGPLTASGSYFG